MNSYIIFEMKIKIKKAKIEDAPGIRDLILVYAKEDKMLPRSLTSIYGHIRDFYVAKEGDKIVGICGIHIVWSDLAEVRSLAVHPDYHDKGLGKKLMKLCIDESKKMGVKKLFALTLVPKFFKKFGFRRVKFSKLPMKVWGDCKHCPKFMECDEVAVWLDLE